jgi:hypothetical protein
MPSAAVRLVGAALQAHAALLAELAHVHHARTTDVPLVCWLATALGIDDAAIEGDTRAFTERSVAPTKARSGVITTKSNHRRTGR